MSVQEAVALEPNEYLSRLFSPKVLGQMPVSGGHRIRRTVLGLIGACFVIFLLLGFLSRPTRFLRILVHNTPRGLEGTSARRPELCRTGAQRGEPVSPRRQRAARSVRCEPDRARTAYHSVWRAACGAGERTGYGKGKGAPVDLERHTGAPAGRRDTADRGV